MSEMEKQFWLNRGASKANSGQLHGWSRSGRKCVTLLLLAALLLSLTAVTANAATHPIGYAIAGPPSLIDAGSLAYFKTNGFSIAELVAPDSGTYQTELNEIKALGMTPVIDIEVVIWNGGQLQSTPITSFGAYFQSLTNAGWQYVASEGGRAGDLTYMKQFFKGYVNYNCDECGLWLNVYTNPFTVINSWESYYPVEWPYVQQGATQAAAAGIQNGIMAGVWANSGGDNQILANSLSGDSPSYKSMLDWSYANGLGFQQFCVWCGLNSWALSEYEQLGFPQIVANLQVDYPATSWGPTIITQPQSQTVNPGANVTFSVTAAGVAPLAYQWCFNAGNIAGATASSYTKNNVQTTNAGSYSVVVTNAMGSVTSAAALLALNVPPTITNQPQSQTVIAGQSVTFSVGAAGTAPLSYQWRFNAGKISGATASSYTKNNVQTTSAGRYSVVVTNVCGSTNSADAVLTVLLPPKILIAPSYSAGGVFQFHLAGAAGSNYVIKASTNLTDWIPLETNTSPFTFTDTNAVNLPLRFYRALGSP
jgi:hypothetical protein